LRRRVNLTARTFIPNNNNNTRERARMNIMAWSSRSISLAAPRACNKIRPFTVCLRRAKAINPLAIESDGSKCRKIHKHPRKKGRGADLPFF